MNTTRRVALTVSILALGLAAEAALEAATRTDRPALKRPLESLPKSIGPWVGRDEPVDEEVLRQSQADDFLNRVYEDPTTPGRRLVLWINYSKHGLNLRHSPEVCLPGGGFTKVESQTRVLGLRTAGGGEMPMTRLVYSKGELAQRIGFWYYIFGEGKLERSVRTLPIASKSSHGRTTRGSGMTVEVFCPGEGDPEGLAIRDFAQALLPELESLLPEQRAAYHNP